MTACTCRLACRGFVVAESEVPHLTKILGGEARVHRGVEAVLGQIPAAAARHPGRLGQPLLNPPVVASLHVLADVEVAQVVPQDRGDPADGVVDLSLHVDEQRVVSRSGVRSRHQEQVRVAVRVDALVGLRTVDPLVGERAAADPGDRVRRSGQMDVVAGGEHDAVQVVLDTVAGADTDRAHCRDRPVDQLAVVALQSRVVVAGDQHALASRGEVRCELTAQPRILDLPAQVRLTQPGDETASAGCPTPSRSR